MYNTLFVHMDTMYEGNLFFNSKRCYIVNIECVRNNRFIGRTTKTTTKLNATFADITSIIKVKDRNNLHDMCKSYIHYRKQNLKLYEKY